MFRGATMAGALVLIVEDDPSTRSLLAQMVEIEGLEARPVASAGEAERAVAACRPAIVLLDLQLPDADGLALLHSLRQIDPDLACIIVSGRDDEASRVLGLRMGADDYVVKPFSSGELLARIESVLRRTRRPRSEPVLQHGPLAIDLASREVRVAGNPVPLTAKEFDLLRFLVASPRQVFTRDQLLEHVWSTGGGLQDPATVTEHVRRLRRKIERDPDQPTLIETVRGVGYRFAGA